MELNKTEAKSWLVEILEKMPKEVVGDKAVVDYLEEYANIVAVNLKDFKHSADIREVLQNPESQKARYDTLIKSAKCNILAGVLQMALVQVSAVANGTMNKVTKNVPFMPAVSFPNNAYGEWMLDATLGFLEYIGHDGKQMVKTEIDKDGKSKGKIIIEE